MLYIDGYVLAVPKANKDKYIALRKQDSKMLKEYGALKIVECWGDEVPEGEFTSFPLAVKCKQDEVVVFSWALWPNKRIRDEGRKKIMSSPRMDFEKNPLPFDSTRIILGGFEVVLEE